MTNKELNLYIQKLFPNNYGFLKQQIDISKDISKVSAEKDKQLEQYFKDHTYNLPLKVQYIKSKSISPFTIPILIDKKLFDKQFNLNKLLLATPILNDIYNVSVANRLLLKANINAELESNTNKIIFTHNKSFNNLQLYIFQPSSYFKLFNNNQVDLRFAIMLHEIGHWVNISEYNIISSLKFLVNLFNIFLIFSVKNTVLLIKIIVPILLFHFFIKNYFNSLNEARCDQFAKKLGYGPQLAEALHIIGSKFDNTMPSIKSIQNEFNSFQSSIADVFNRLLGGYPSMQNRIRTLMDSGSCDMSNFLILEEVDSLDNNLKTQILLSLNASMIAFCNKLDSKIRF